MAQSRSITDDKGNVWWLNHAGDPVKNGVILDECAAVKSEYAAEERALGLRLLAVAARDLSAKYDSQGRPYRDLCGADPVPPGLQELRDTFDGKDQDKPDGVLLTEPDLEWWKVQLRNLEADANRIAHESKVLRQKIAAAEFLLHGDKT